MNDIEQRLIKLEEVAILHKIIGKDVRKWKKSRIHGNTNGQP